jgi:hypothetical protein
MRPQWSKTKVRSETCVKGAWFSKPARSKDIASILLALQQ